MFHDYATFLGMKEEHYRTGLEAYLLHNAKAKENIKSMFCMPYSFELGGEGSVPEVVKVIINEFRNIYMRKMDAADVPGDKLALFDKEFTLKNIIDNRASSGMKLSKWFLKFMADNYPQMFDYGRANVFKDIVYGYLEINGSTTLTHDLLIQRLMWYISNQVSPIRVKISTELDDIMECSTNCSWSSCYAPSGSYRTAPFAFALDECTAIALFYKGKSKVGRVWVHIDSIAGRFVIGRNYGNIPTSQINMLADKVQSLLGFTKGVSEDSGVWTGRKHNMSYVDAPSAVRRDEAIPLKTIDAGAFSSGVPHILCLHCGDPISRQGELICENCRKNKMKKCGHCGNSFFGEMQNVLSGKKHGVALQACPRCVTNYKKCECCGEHTIDTVKGMCRGCYEKTYKTCKTCGHEYQADKHEDCPRCAILVGCDSCKKQIPIFTSVPAPSGGYYCTTCFLTTLC